MDPKRRETNDMALGLPQIIAWREFADRCLEGRTLMESSGLPELRRQSWQSETMMTRVHKAKDLRR